MRPLVFASLFASSLAMLLPIGPAAAQQQEGGKKAAPGDAPPAEQPAEKPVRFRSFPVAEGAAFDVADATARGVEALLRLPEGDGHDQWPYEGVYREDGGQLPVGYRVGGTSIVCLALIAAPGFDKDAARQDALARGVGFVLQTLEHPRMGKDFIGTYDVRGWGHIYALQLFLQLLDHGLVPPAHAT